MHNINKTHNYGSLFCNQLCLKFLANVTNEIIFTIQLCKTSFFSSLQWVAMS